MPHSYAQNTIHLIFSTKNRRKTIPREMQNRLWPYISAICQENKIFVHAVGGMEDHCHVLFLTALEFPDLDHLTINDV
jgi:putative transposase